MAIGVLEIKWIVHVNSTFTPFNQLFLHEDLQKDRWGTKQSSQFTCSSSFRPMAKTAGWWPKEWDGRQKVRSSVIQDDLGAEPLLLQFDRSKLSWYSWWGMPSLSPLSGVVPSTLQVGGDPGVDCRNYNSLQVWEHLGPWCPGTATILWFSWITQLDPIMSNSFSIYNYIIDQNTIICNYYNGIKQWNCMTLSSISSKCVSSHLK